jgi:hypothetical protein
MCITDLERVVMILTSLIYLRAGREIYAKRKSLRNFRAPPPQPMPIIGDPFQSVKTTEVFVTSEQADDISPSDSIDLRKLGPDGAGYPRPPQPTKNAYTVTVSSSQQAPNFPPPPLPERFSYIEKSPLDRKSSIPGSDEMPLPAMSAYQPSSERSKLYPTRRHAANQADSAAWSYTKVAALFMVAMMVTWIPSSANRVYSVVHPGTLSIGLSYASAFVLPLQGFWNALIYTTTSLNGCRLLWADIIGRGRSNGIRQIGGVFTENRENSRNKYVETDSMTELASRPDTKGSGR